MIALVFIFHYTSHRVTLDDRIRSQYEPVWEYVTPDVFNTICEYKKSQNYLQNFIYKMIALGVVDALLIFMSIYAQWNPFIVFIVIISVLFFLQFYSEYLNEKRWTKISDSAQYCYLPVKVLRVSSNSQNHFVYVSVVKNNRKYIYKCVCCPGQIIERIMIVSDGSKSTYILP
ncbi:MAG: hypothetical protein Q4F95_15045 [Oscillospiraceae bacterium]|nr:hypothetical protein [Oscillospiraceae bacterium]